VVECANDLAILDKLSTNLFSNIIIGYDTKIVGKL
jgi:hypothetical protein